MRYYVIINGTNSLTIPGLAIKDLPPISKTLMRNQKETIDGRDGDIITELGYSAYDKALTIGLYGSYDINDIIAFFNQKGTIVFSDEPDKYYNFTILDQIDYDKLVKFRTATIRIHCQPFKYPVSETPIEIEAEYVTAQGEDITLNNTGVAPLKLTLKGNTNQETTTGKNLLRTNFPTTTYRGVNISTDSDGTINFVGTLTSDFDYRFNIGDIVLPAGTYTFSSSQTLLTLFYISLYDSNNSRFSQMTPNTNKTTFTLEQPTTIGSIRFWVTKSQNPTLNFHFKLMLESGSTATDYEPYTGGIPAPNPGFPMPVQVVTGDNEIKIQNKNFLNESEVLSYTISTAQEDIYPNNNRYAYLVKVLPNTTYTFSRSSVNTATLNYIALLNNFVPNTRNQYIRANNISSNLTYTFTTTADTNYVMFLSGSGYSLDLQLEKGSTATNFVEHREQNYPINLGGLEFCKIENYEDYIYGSPNNWYKHKAIGKKNLSEIATWLRDNELTNSWRFYSRSNTIESSNSGVSMTNYFRNDTPANVTNLDAEALTVINRTQIALRINKTRAVDETTLKNWIFNNNVYTYHVLDTPTSEQITDTTLIEQLNAILNAASYEDQTNISQENDNMPFILDVSALQKGTNEAIIDNEGNIYSKPIINIVGDGIVGVSLNGSQILSLDMTTYNDITIDTETMEAYDNNGLRNRQVTGNYNNLRLQPGENTISLNGGFTSATISKYKRWL